MVREQRNDSMPEAISEKENQMEEENSLVGIWKLASWEAQTAEGNTVHPFGENAAGWINMETDGRSGCQKQKDLLRRTHEAHL